jgi:hypothetical protein
MINKKTKLPTNIAYYVDRQYIPSLLSLRKSREREVWYFG